MIAKAELPVLDELVQGKKIFIICYSFNFVSEESNKFKNQVAIISHSFSFSD